MVNNKKTLYTHWPLKWLDMDIANMKHCNYLNKPCLNHINNTGMIECGWQIENGWQMETASAADARIQLQKSSTLYICADGLTIVTRAPACSCVVTCRKPALSICGRCKLSVSCTMYTYSIETAVMIGVQHKFRERSWLHMKRIFMALPRYHHYVILSKWPQHMNDVCIHHKNIKLEATYSNGQSELPSWCAYTFSWQ